MKRRVVIIAVLAATGLAMWLFVHLRSACGSAQLTVTSTGPLDIRLWGIRPDAGDVIYDLDGNETCQTLGVSWDSSNWGEKVQRFDFIFELPDTGELPLFKELSRFEVNGEDRPLAISVFQQILAHEDRRVLWVRSTFVRTFRRSVLRGLWISNTKIDTVDITLEYFHGLPGKSVFTVEGPFKQGSVVSSDREVYDVSFTKDLAGGYAFFELSRPTHFNRAMSVVVYDESGSRHLADRVAIRSKGQTGLIEYRVPNMSFDRMSSIAFGEQQYEITFKGVNLRVGGSKRRTYGAYLDKMGERLGLTMTGKELANYRFETATEALDVIDVVRGSMLVQAARAVLRQWPNPQDLSDEQTARLAEALGRWITAEDPLIRAFAVSIGLRCKWPNFIDPAIELLERPAGLDHYAENEIRDRATQSLRYCAGELSDDHIRRIADLMLSETRWQIRSGLLRLLDTPKMESRIKAFWRLAEDDRTRLWWFAVARLSAWKAFKGKYDSLPDKLKLRVFLIHGRRGFSDPDQIEPRAHDLLAGLLTPDLRGPDSGIFCGVLAKIAEKLDVETKTEIAIRALPHIERFNYPDCEIADIIVKYVNLWHGLDIGGLGDDVNLQTPDIRSYDWRAITAEAIEWYDTEYNAADPNSAR